MTSKSETNFCVQASLSLECACGESINPARYRLGFRTCMTCGESEAKRRRFTIVPMHKSNYIPVFNTEMLAGINSKTHRG